MKKDENSEKIKADQSEDIQSDQELLRKRSEVGDKEEAINKSARVVMPSIPGPFISKDEFIGLQKAELSDALIQKYYERYMTMFKEEELRYYIDQHQDDIWFSDLYNPFTGQKLEGIKLQNNLKKHRLFVEAINTEWISSFDISGKETVVNTSTFVEHIGYKCANAISGAVIHDNLKQLYGSKEYVIDALPKDVSVGELWTKLSQNDWFWDLNTSLPIKHNNYTRTVYLTKNPLNTTANDTKTTSLDTGDYSFKLFDYQCQVFDVFIKTYTSDEEVKKDINGVLSLINSLIEMNQLSADDLYNALSSASHSKKLSILTYYLWTVWGIDIISLTKCDKNLLRKRILLSNAESIIIPDSYVPEPAEDPRFVVLTNLLAEEGSEDRLNSIVDSKLEAKIKTMLEEYEEGVWPCPKCGKFFENADYVVKHFGQKHQDKMEKYRSQLKLGIKNSDFTNEKYKDVLIGNYQNKINFNPFKDAAVFREMERLKDRQALKLNYRWKFIEEY